jgi:hypothetical protein
MGTRHPGGGRFRPLGPLDNWYRVRACVCVWGLHGAGPGVMMSIGDSDNMLGFKPSQRDEPARAEGSCHST